MKPHHLGPILPLASSDKRLLNFLIDTTFNVGGYMSLNAMFDLMIPLISNSSIKNPTADILILLICLLPWVLNNLILEALIGRSLGKIFTHTLVLTSDNKKPQPWQILVRFLVRIIPFGLMSFHGTMPRGLHDKLSKTKVVDTKHPTQFTKKIRQIR